MISSVTCGRTGDGELVDVAWFPAEVEAGSRARRFLEDLLDRWAVNGDLLADAALVTTELVSNVVRHSSSRSVGVEVHLDGAGRMTVVVSEQHASDIPGALAEAAVLPSAPSVRGRGLAILDALADQWGVTRVHRTTATWFTLVPDDGPSIASQATSVGAADVGARSDRATVTAGLDSLHTTHRGFQLLLRLSREFALATTPYQVSSAVAVQLRRHLDALYTGVALLSESRTRMRFVGFDPCSPSGRTRSAPITLAPSDPVAAAVLDGRPFFHPSATGDPEFPGLTDHAATGISFALAHLPLLVDGAPFGTLVVAWRELQPPDPDLRALLSAVAAATAQALRRM